MDRSKTTEKSGGTNYWLTLSGTIRRLTLLTSLMLLVNSLFLPISTVRRRKATRSLIRLLIRRSKAVWSPPTAGLHFTDKVLADLDAHGIVRDEVTPHVGAGTFKPVKTEEIEGHKMHSEYIVVHRHTFEHLLEHDCKAIAVGTTSVRTLESLYYIGVKILKNPNATEEEPHVEQWEPYDLPHDEEGLVILDGKAVSVRETIQAILDYLNRDNLEALHTSTQIIIAPGYIYKIVKMLVTNFHQPKSTLLLLVSAFLKGDWRKVYDYALSHGFRFLSYGDANLLMP